jgi:hypothetical protein
MSQFVRNFRANTRNSARQQAVGWQWISFGRKKKGRSCDQPLKGSLNLEGVERIRGDKRKTSMDASAKAH